MRDKYIKVETFYTRVVDWITLWARRSTHLLTSAIRWPPLIVVWSRRRIFNNKSAVYYHSGWWEETARRHVSVDFDTEAERYKNGIIVNSGYGQKRELHESEMVTGRFADRTFSRQVVTSEINLRGLSVETTDLISTIDVKKRSNKNKKTSKT